MKKFFEKIFTIVAIFLSIYNSTFACINDEDTNKSETLWGKTYDNVVFINWVTALIIVLIYLLILLKITFKDRKTIGAEELFFLTFKWVLTSVIVIVMIIGTGIAVSFFLGIFIFIFCFNYLIHFVKNIIKYLKENKTTESKIVKRFKYLLYLNTVFGIFYWILYLLSYILGFVFGPIIITAGLILFFLIWLMLLWSVLLIDNYNYKTYTISILFIYGLFIFPSLIQNLL